MVMSWAPAPNPIPEPTPRLASHLTLLTNAEQEMTLPPTQNDAEARYIAGHPRHRVGGRSEVPNRRSAPLAHGA